MRFSRLVLCVCAIFFIFLPAGLRAQTTVCDGIVDSGDRLECKHGRMLEVQGSMISKLQDNFGQFIPGNAMTRLQRAHGRAANAKQRVSGKQFKSLGKKNPSKDCGFQVFPGTDTNNNGICDAAGEQCLNKDLVSTCKVKGKNSGEDCVEICTGDQQTIDDVDEQVLLDVEQSYDDITESLQDVNAVLDSEGQVMAAMAGSLLNASEPNESCRASADWQAYTKFGVVTGLKLTSVILRANADVAGTLCGEVIAGFTVSFVCTPLEGAAGVAATAAQIAESVVDGFKVASDQAQERCLSSLSADLQQTKTALGTLESTTTGNSGQLNGVVTDVENIKTTVNDLATKVNALSSTLEALQKRTADLLETMNNRFNNVETLLNTPQGRRDSFPSQK